MCLYDSTTSKCKIIDLREFRRILSEKNTNQKLVSKECKENSKIIKLKRGSCYEFPVSYSSTFMH